MATFFSIAFSFPTVIFTVLLCVAVIYWLVSLLGLFDLDGNDIDVSTDFGGLLVTLGLQGVPLPLVMTVLLLSGWLLTYFAMLLFGSWLGSGWLLLVLGALLLMVAASVGLIITSIIVRPLRPLFRRAYSQPLEKRVIGTVCTIRSAMVDQRTGQAEANLDGAHLILQVRADKALTRRDRAVLVEYLPDERAYWVVPEAEFNAGHAGQ